MDEIGILLTIDRHTAWELAQFAKRLGFHACYELTEAHLHPKERVDKAYLMLHGVDLVARALSNAGFTPR